MFEAALKNYLPIEKDAMVAIGLTVFVWNNRNYLRRWSSILTTLDERPVFTMFTGM